MACIPTPRTQGLQSTTFTQPPLDGSLSLPALYDWQGSHSPRHPLYSFEDKPGSQRIILWDEGLQGIQRATRLVRHSVGKTDNGDAPVVAVLASSDSITFATFILGTLRSGCVLFPLSLRNSAAAVTALLKQTGASHLFVSSDTKTQDLANAAMKDLAPENAVKKHDMPVFEDLYPVKGVDPTFVAEALSDVDMSETALILHSSGTTAFPKPIYMTHRSLVESATLACFGDTDLARSVIGCHSIPMFHGLGLGTIILPVASGTTMAFFKPQSPPVTPDPLNTFEGATSSKCDYVMVAPTFVETWSQNSQIVEGLTRLKGIIYGSGPLTKVAGDILASSGVALLLSFGTTQTMKISNFLQKPVGMDWEYFQVSPSREVHLIDHGNNEFELIVLATDWYRPGVINTQVNGRDAYATSDLLSPHPTKPGFWKVVGRTDDQIMHSTGEKTNPGPLEGMLMRNEFVSGAVVFGRGRFQCGVLVEPKKQYEFDPAGTKKLVEFRSMIWPTIESMNAFAPTHSRIFKEMILVASPSKPFTYTDKGSLRRQAIINEYAAEIDALYAAVDESSQDDIPSPSDWTLPQTIDFVRQVVGSTMTKRDDALVGDVDFFEMGLDSLQAAWIRNSILRAVRESRPSLARQIPSTFVYDHPSIKRLSEYFVGVVTGAISSFNVHNILTKRRELLALVDKHTASFPSFSARQTELPVGSVVLLTGGTGSVGSNILAKLLQDASITRVYAMSRPSSSGLSAKERHLKAFEREGLDLAMLDNPKVQFLDGDAESRDFGIDCVLFQEMQNSVTHIIHNAWRVNFNVTVTSFESNIRSVRNFIDFALGETLPKPARIIFISSIGVFQNYFDNKLAPEEYLEQPDSAIGTGYSESKWVSENILRRATEKTPLSATVVRCGQMTGGPSGAWNEHEWFPSLIKSSIALGKLPDADGNVSWVTTHDAGGTIVDMLNSEDGVLHLVHPSPVTWSSIITAFAKELNLSIVPYSEWLTELEDAYAALDAVSSDPAKVESVMRENPALRLVDFFKAGQKQSRNTFMEPIGIAKLENSKAVKASQTLREANPIDVKNIERWISYWRKSRFLPSH